MEIRYVQSNPIFHTSIPDGTLISPIYIYLQWPVLCYRDESLSGTELTSKLEPAFLAGLRCNKPPIRQKFVEVNISLSLSLSLQNKRQSQEVQIIT